MRLRVIRVVFEFVEEPVAVSVRVLPNAKPSMLERYNK